MLEPIAVKVARWVPRGGSGSNVTSLPDQATPLRAAPEAHRWADYDDHHRSFGQTGE